MRFFRTCCYFCIGWGLAAALAWFLISYRPFTPARIWIYQLTRHLSH
jgi:hypothetical protein